MKKRLVCMLLAVMLIFSVFVPQTFAAEPTKGDEASQTLDVRANAKSEKREKIAYESDEEMPAEPTELKVECGETKPISETRDYNHNHLEAYASMDGQTICSGETYPLYFTAYTYSSSPYAFYVIEVFDSDGNFATDIVGCTGEGEFPSSIGATNLVIHWDTTGVPSGRYTVRYYSYVFIAESFFEEYVGTFDVYLTPSSGTCGDNLKWKYYPDTETLKITGKGNMYNYESDYPTYYNYYDRALKLDLPYTMTSIGSSAFWNFMYISSIIIPANTSVIGYDALRECDSLTSVKFGENVTCIAGGALAYCDSLTDVYVYNADAVIHTATYGYTLGIPGIATIHCYKNSTADVQAKATGFYSSYFSESGKAGSSLTWTFNPNTNSLDIVGSGKMYNYNNYSNPAPWKKYASDCTTINLPWQMTRISVCAFLGFSNVQDIIIPQNCTYIDDYAFQACSSMKKASFVTATHIGQNALNQCTSLKDVYVFKPNCEIVDTAGTGRTLGVPGYTVIHADVGSTAQAYALKYGYTFVDRQTGLPTGKAGNNLIWTYNPSSKTLTITGSGDMYNYNNYNNPAPWKAYADTCTSISLPWQMTRISVCAFLGFNNVQDIIIPQNCTYIDDYAFQNCSDMLKASFVTATYIGQNALNGCTSLKDVFVFKDNCQIVDTANTGKTLGKPGYTVIHANVGSTAYNYAMKYGYAFVDMQTNLPTGKAGNNLTWTYNPSTKALTISGSGDMYNYNNYNNPAPWKAYADTCTSITLPWQMTRISVCAFLGFRNVPNIIIPQNCTYIDDYAFQACTSMVKASFVTATHIGQNALNQCSSLRDVYVFLPYCEIVDTANTGKTLGRPGYTVIHAPAGSTAQAYANRYGYAFVEYNP